MNHSVSIALEFHYIKSAKKAITKKVIIANLWSKDHLSLKDNEQD